MNLKSLNLPSYASWTHHFLENASQTLAATGGKKFSFFARYADNKINY